MIKKVEILFRQVILKLLLILSKRRTIQNKPVITPLSKVLFIRLNRIGDALVTTPLLRQIKKQIGCSISVLADKNNHFVFEHCESVDSIIIYEKRLKGIQKLNSYIKKNKIDTLVDLHDDVSTSVSFILSKAPVKQIFGLKKENEKLYTHTVERLNSSAHHIIERTLELSKLFGFNPDYQNAEVDYQINQKSIDFAESFMNQFTGKFKLGINITAGSPARFWGVNNYKALIKLISNYELNYIVFTNEEYFDKAKQITEEKNIYPPGKDFDIFAAGISKLDILFTPDTSIIHICSEFRIPVFGLYVKYKTDDMIWSPYNSEFKAVITKEATLENVTFNEVKNKFIPFLEKHLNAKRNS
jgi:ADP-heptose:LPS heptosyltransferase